jgi:sugar phosphate isomerase/epimerase
MEPEAMTIRIGFDQYTIGHRQLSPHETLDFAVEHGLDGVQFLEPSSIAEDLNPRELAAFQRDAEARKLYLEVGLPSPNPARRTRSGDALVLPKEHARALARHVEGVAALGCRHARVYVGDRHDRFRGDFTWADQLSATQAVLKCLTPCLRGLGVRLAIETHADLTVDELLGLIDPLDPDVVGVTLDTGNLVMRLDDPVWAVERLAPWVVCTHVKDCVLAETPRGLCWQVRPVGSGCLPMPDLIAPLIRANPKLNLSIELHPRTYDLPINDPTWLGHFPSLRAEGLAAVIRLAEVCEERYASGFVDRPEIVEAIPWPDRDLDWLASSLGYLRRVLPALAEPEPVTAFPRMHREE